MKVIGGKMPPMTIFYLFIAWNQALIPKKSPLALVQLA